MENDNRVDLPYVASRLIGIANAKDKDLRKKIEEFREECLRNIGVNVVNEQWGEQMDTSKFKSVTISIETWKMLHELADAEMRSVSRTIEYLVNKYKEEQEKDHG